MFPDELHPSSVELDLCGAIVAVSEAISDLPEVGQLLPASLESAGARHTVALALHLHVPLKKLQTVLISFFLYLYLLDIFHIDSLLLYFSCYFCFVIAADVGFSLREIFLPRFPPQPYYCGCPRIMESTFQIFCL